MKAKTFILYIGYVESSSVGCLIFSHTEGFETAKEGLQSLADTLWAMLQESEHPTPAFCEHCMQSLPKGGQPLGRDDFTDYIISLIAEEAGTWPGRAYNTMAGAGWELGLPVSYDAKHLLLDGIVHVPDRAEDILTDLVFPEEGNFGEWGEDITCGEGVKLL